MTKNLQKLFRFEMDQSVRFEELNRDTVVALANRDHSFTLRVPIRIKRQLHDQFRRSGKIRQFAPRTFKAAIMLCLQNANFQIHELAIDLEYPGYEERLLADLKDSFPKLIAHTVLVGRKSPAHRAAYDVHANKKQADMTATYEQLTQVSKMTRELLHAGRNRTIRSPRGPSRKHYNRRRKYVKRK